MATVSDTPTILNVDIETIAHWLHRRLSWHHGMTAPTWQDGAIYTKPEPDPPVRERNGYCIRLAGEYARRDKYGRPITEGNLFPVVNLRLYPIPDRGGPRVEVHSSCHPALSLTIAGILAEAAQFWPGAKPNGIADMPLDERSVFLKAARDAYEKLAKRGGDRRRPAQDDLAKEMEFRSTDTFIRRRQDLGWRMYDDLVAEIAGLA